MIRYGPAGFDYRDWAGQVYPAPQPRGFDRLAYLADYFDTVEINSSFYGPPAPSTSEAWARRVEAHPRFQFTAKLWRRFTHERAQAWTQEEVDQVRAGFAPLLEHDRLGAVVLQFPWSFRRTEANEEWLHDVLSAFPELPKVVEVRHVSWATEEALTPLLERGVGLVNVDQPLFKNSIRPAAVSLSPVGYVRLHGRNYRDWFRAKAGRDERYDYLYTAAELQPWAERVAQVDAHPRTQRTFAVTNNHFRGQAPANALMLQSLVEERRVGAPPPLYEAFEEALAHYARPRASHEADADRGATSDRGAGTPA